MNGWQRIAAERQRQIEKEGFDELHDADHEGGQLIEAAVCYAIAAEATYYSENNVTFNGFRPGDKSVPAEWPWDAKWWKPSGFPIRNLERAGALIAAEIDRLDRAITSEVGYFVGDPK